MSIRLSCLVMPLVLAAAVCLPASSYAWGEGHGHQAVAAIQELPAPLRTFFEQYQGRLWNMAISEPPGYHFIKIDVYPEFFAHTFPRDLDAAIARYGAQTLTNYGMGPWWAVSNYETLRGLFAGARTESDWTNLLATAGALAHYVGDLHQPLHLAVNIDGQLTGQNTYGGVHAGYEGWMIAYAVRHGFHIATNAAGCVYYPSMLDAIFDDIDLVYPCVSNVLAADRSAFAAAGERSSDNYCQHLWDDGCSSFTPFVMQRAADMIASAWYSAWREAGFPQPFNVAPSRVVHLRFIGVDTNGCRLSIAGDAGQRLELQTSTNLTSWSRVATLTNLNGRVDVTVPPPIPKGQPFYRARLLPSDPALDCVSAAAGLVGWWPADANANDIAGPNIGTLRGGATAGAAGVVGPGFSFDGTNSYVQIPDSPVLRPTNLTVEAWVLFSSLESAGSGGSPAGQQYIVFKQNTRGGNFEGYDLGKWRSGGQDFFAFRVASSAGALAETLSTTAVTTGIWYHVAAVRGSNFLQLYVNGQLESQTSVSFAQNYGNFPLYFGTSGQSYWDRKFNGRLDEVSLYNRALSAEEIAAIHAAGAIGKCK